MPLQTIKGHLNSQTAVSIILLALTSIGQLIANNFEMIEKAVLAVVPEPWQAIASSALALIIMILTALGIRGRQKANGGLKGLWKKESTL